MLIIDIINNNKQASIINKTSNYHKSQRTTRITGRSREERRSEARTASFLKPAMRSIQIMKSDSRGQREPRERVHDVRRWVDAPQWIRDINILRQDS